MKEEKNIFYFINTSLEVGKINYANHFDSLKTKHLIVVLLKFQQNFSHSVLMIVLSCLINSQDSDMFIKITGSCCNYELKKAGCGISPEKLSHFL